MSDAGPSRGPGTRRGKRRVASGASGGAPGSAYASPSTTGVAGPSEPTKRPRRRTKEHRAREHEHEPAQTAAWARGIIEKTIEVNVHVLHELDPGRFPPDELTACPQCRARRAQTTAIMKLGASLRARSGHKTRVASLRRFSRDASDGAVPPSPSSPPHSSVAWSNTRLGRQGGRARRVSGTPPPPSTLCPNRPAPPNATEPEADAADESGEDDDGGHRSSRRDKGKGRADPPENLPPSEVGTDERVSWELDDQEHEARVANDASSSRATGSREKDQRDQDVPENDAGSDVDDTEVWMTPQTRARLTWDRRRRDMRIAQALLPHLKEPLHRAAKPIRLPHPTISDAIHRYAAEYYGELGAMRPPFKQKRTTPWPSEKRRELEEAGVWDEWEEEDPAETSGKDKGKTNDKPRYKTPRGPYNSRNMYGQFDGTAMLAFSVLFEELVRYQLEQTGYRPNPSRDAQARRKRRLRRKRHRAVADDADETPDPPAAKRRRTVRFSQVDNVMAMDDSPDEDASEAERAISTVVLEDSDDDIGSKSKG